MVKHYVFGSLSFFMAFFASIVFIKVSVGALLEKVAPKPGVPEGSFVFAVAFVWLGLYMFRKGLRVEAAKAAAKDKELKRAA